MSIQPACAVDEPPPARRRHVRVPRKFSFAVTPVDRLILLAGGAIADLAVVFGVTEATVAGWRAPTRGAGYLPAMHLEAAQLWLAAQGWGHAPEGFLTRHGEFSDPREEQGDA